MQTAIVFSPLVLDAVVLTRLLNNFAAKRGVLSTHNMAPQLSSLAIMLRDEFNAQLAGVFLINSFLNIHFFAYNIRNNLISIIIRVQEVIVYSHKFGYTITSLRILVGFF